MLCWGAVFNPAALVWTLLTCGRNLFGDFLVKFSPPNHREEALLGNWLAGAVANWELNLWSLGKCFREIFTSLLEATFSWRYIELLTLTCETINLKLACSKPPRPQGTSQERAQVDHCFHSPSIPLLHPPICLKYLPHGGCKQDSFSDLNQTFCSGSKMIYNNVRSPAFQMFAALLLLPLQLSLASSSPGESPPPNLVMIVADDLGWGDAPWHDSHIQAPRQWYFLYWCILF